MAKGAKRVEQLIKIDLAVLPAASLYAFLYKIPKSYHNIIRGALHAAVVYSAAAFFVVPTSKKGDEQYRKRINDL